MSLRENHDKTDATTARPLGFCASKPRHGRRGRLSLSAAAQPAGKTPQPEIDDEVTITGARRREETAQEVPIPVSVVDGELITESGAFNVNRIKELIASVQLYSSNPRNTGVNIRGLGSPFGLTNDGI